VSRAIDLGVTQADEAALVSADVDAQQLFKRKTFKFLIRIRARNNSM
jgi:hypothetical protein